MPPLYLLSTTLNTTPYMRALLSIVDARFQITSDNRGLVHPIAFDECHGNLKQHWQIGTEQFADREVPLTT